MLQAKLYLNADAMTGEAKYTECITACRKVIDAGYSLDPNYQALFMIDNDQSPEIIFALNADGRRTQSWGTTTFLVHAAIGGLMDPLQYGVNDGWAGLRTTSAMLDKFPDLTGATDKRGIFFTDGQNIEIEDIGVFEDGIAVPKYTNTNLAGDAGSDPTHVDTDYPMFRLADAWLMYAEAILRGGQGGSIDEAEGLINQLRERAYGDNSGQITSAELTLDFILDERVRELYWEASRRIDLVRFGQFTETTVWPWKGGVREGRPTESFRTIFPIPASDLTANPNLIQNPGY